VPGVPTADKGAGAAAAGAGGRDDRRELLERLKQELDACGFNAAEAADLFPDLAPGGRSKPRTIEDDLAAVERIRLRVEGRTEERVRRELTQKVLAALSPPAAPAG